MFTFSKGFYSTNYLLKKFCLTPNLEYLLALGTKDICKRVFASHISVNFETFVYVL